ncbi:nuclear transport factor 2 family protein [Nocardia sp. NPDC049526]|uniref:nuclear transport factor 2 family protein n=1 Tax=Nocardia sp. NPDC049526 TaxID=3364316 RepID=UPI0037B8FFA6
MRDTQSQTTTLDSLPEIIIRYTGGHRAHDSATTITAFTDEATVVDDGHIYHGIAAIEQWLGQSSTEYTYTIEPIAAQVIDNTHYVVTQHLEGNFPGGTVDLRYQFTLNGNGTLIEQLTIEP